MPTVGVGHSTHLVAVGLVQYSYLEHQVVDGQKEYAPLYKWHVESFYALLHKCSLVVQIFQREEVACCDEEQRHVELEDKRTERTWSLGMGYHHQYDGYTLGYRYHCVSVHTLL